MTIDHMDSELDDRELEARLGAYYEEADRIEEPPSADAIWLRVAPALREAGAETATASPLPGVAPDRSAQQRTQRGRWQGLAAVAAAVIIVALFARVLTLALSGNRIGTPAVTPSTTAGPKGPLSALSPELATYVAAQGGNMAVVIDDLTHNRYYSANETESFVLAGSAKVYIMAAYLDWVEAQGRTPSDAEVNLLTAMIEHGDNDAAQELFSRLGQDVQIQRFLYKIGVAGYVSCQWGWGCAQAPPSAMARVLALLRQGEILSAADRHLALDLLSHVESDQRMGVGDTAPDGATVYMKAGWLQWPDTGIVWTLNSSGIVSTGGETYIVVVYTQNQPSYDWSAIDHVCAVVAHLLG